MYPVEKMCIVLQVSRSAYYIWLKYSQEENSKDELGEQIESMYFEYKQRYGSPRLTVELNAMGLKVSRNTVAKKLKERGLKARSHKRFKIMTTDSNHQEPIAPNLLERNFHVDEPGKMWVSDITYLRTLEGFLYLTVIIDLYDRKVVGWALSDGMTTQETVLSAWYMALGNRPPKDELIFHSDRGIQYACLDFRNALKSQGTKQSMSRKGDCWDNAVAESFFKSLKTEAIYGFKIKTKEQMRAEIFEYIEIWYNRKRRHSYLEFLTILEKEIQDGVYLSKVA